MKKFNFNVRLNGTLVTRRQDTIFVPLQPELWKSCGRCDCDLCKGKEGFWDTLAIAKDTPKGRIRNDYTWTVHYPQLHNPLDYAEQRKVRGVLLIVKHEDDVEL